MIEISCEGILFDLDGVLIDSTPAVQRVWGWWASERGLNPEEVVRKAHGRPSIATIREYVPEAVAEVENSRVERAEIEDLDGVVPLPGARELLDSLPVKAWTIVTSGTRRLAEVRIRAAGLPLPKQMVTATDVKKGKPNPEPYLKGAALLGRLPERCIVVEDAPAGIRAGQTSGARVVALTTTLSVEEIRATRPNWIVNDCSALSVCDSTGDSLRLSLSDLLS